MLGDVCRLLSDVETVVGVSERVEALAAASEWPRAVAVLIEACNKLAREELSGVSNHAPVYSCY